MNASARRGLVLACGALALALMACASVPNVELYNNTPVKVGVGVLRSKYMIEAARAKSFTYPESLAKAAAHAAKMWVCLGGKAFQYQVPFPPREYVGSGILRGTIRVQLEPDGAIRILRPQEPFPLTEGAGQPARFPLTPLYRGACKESGNEAAGAANGE